jgi:hypothetical protein
VTKNNNTSGQDQGNPFATVRRTIVDAARSASPLDPNAQHAVLETALREVADELDVTGTGSAWARQMLTIARGAAMHLHALHEARAVAAIVKSPANPRIAIDAAVHYATMWKGLRNDVDVAQRAAFARSVLQWWTRSRRSTPPRLTLDRELPEAELCAAIHAWMSGGAKWEAMRALWKAAGVPIISAQSAKVEWSKSAIGATTRSPAARRVKARAGR